MGGKRFWKSLKDTIRGFFMFFIIFVIGTYIHEIGHFVGAKLFGFEVDRVVFGDARVGFRFQNTNFWFGPPLTESDLKGIAAYVKIKGLDELDDAFGFSRVKKEELAVIYFAGFFFELMFSLFLGQLFFKNMPKDITLIYFILIFLTCFAGSFADFVKAMIVLAYP